MLVCVCACVLHLYIFICNKNCTGRPTLCFIELVLLMTMPCKMFYLVLKSGHWHGNDQGSEQSITIGASAPVPLLTVSPLDLFSCLQPLSTTDLSSISATLAFLDRVTNKIYIMQALRKMMFPGIIP